MRQLQRDRAVPGCPQAPFLLLEAPQSPGRQRPTQRVPVGLGKGAMGGVERGWGALWGLPPPPERPRWLQVLFIFMALVMRMVPQ